MTMWIEAQMGLFRSLYLGSEFVGETNLNVPDHLRLAGLCLKFDHLYQDQEVR